MQSVCAIYTNKCKWDSIATIQPVMGRTKINIKSPRDPSPESIPDLCCLPPTIGHSHATSNPFTQWDPEHCSPGFILVNLPDCPLYIPSPNHSDLVGVPYPGPSLVWPPHLHFNQLVGFCQDPLCSTVPIQNPSHTTPNPYPKEDPAHPSPVSRRVCLIFPSTSPP